MTIQASAQPPSPSSETAASVTSEALVGPAAREALLARADKDMSIQLYWCIGLGLVAGIAAIAVLGVGLMNGLFKPLLFSVIPGGLAVALFAIALGLTKLSKGAAISFCIAVGLYVLVAAGLAYAFSTEIAGHFSSSRRGKAAFAFGLILMVAGSYGVLKTLLQWNRGLFTPEDGRYLRRLPHADAMQATYLEGGIKPYASGTVVPLSSSGNTKVILWGGAAFVALLISAWVAFSFGSPSSEAPQSTAPSAAVSSANPSANGIARSKPSGRLSQGSVQALSNGVSAADAERNMAVVLRFKNIGPSPALREAVRTGAISRADLEALQSAYKTYAPSDSEGRPVSPSNRMDRFLSVLGDDYSRANKANRRLLENILVTPVHELLETVSGPLVR